MRHSQYYKIGERVEEDKKGKGTVANCCWDFNAGDWLYDIHWDDGSKSDIYQEFLAVP